MKEADLLGGHWLRKWIAALIQKIEQQSFCYDRAGKGYCRPIADKKGSE